MKVLFLADPSASHTIKWVNSLSGKGLDITVFGLKEYGKPDYPELDNLRIIGSGFKTELFQKQDGSLSKLVYLKEFPRLKKIIKDFKPDILHAHYATSYGLLGALANFHPYLISVWGSDVYNFPGRSLVHKNVFKYILSKADRVLSTSRVMSAEIGKYSGKRIFVTPFGIDLEKFFPQQVDSIFGKDDIVIGTIKTLEKKYGIEYLLQAFKILKDKHPELPLKLLISGPGTQKDELKNLAAGLGILNDTKFTGFINHNDVPRYQNMIDIFVSLSVEDSESFGVAVLEASACGKPVVVSNAGGLPEIVADNETGFVVDKKNARQAADAIEQLLLDKNLRAAMGKNGRMRAAEFYNLSDNVDQMMKIYKEVLE